MLQGLSWGDGAALQAGMPQPALRDTARHHGSHRPGRAPRPDLEAPAISRHQKRERGAELRVSLEDFPEKLPRP